MSVSKLHALIATDLQAMPLPELEACWRELIRLRFAVDHAKYQPDWAGQPTQRDAR